MNTKKREWKDISNTIGGIDMRPQCTYVHNLKCGVSDCSSCVRILVQNHEGYVWKQGMLEKARHIQNSQGKQGWG